jgi:hypothetical protein
MQQKQFGKVSLIFANPRPRTLRVKKQTPVPLIERATKMFSRFLLGFVALDARLFVADFTRVSM